MPYAEVNEIKIYFEVYGSGHPLVLIPGLGSEIRSWAVQIPVYSKHFQLIAADTRGSGKSEKPDVPYTIELLADDIYGLLKTLGIKSAYVMGKSMGGMIAQWLAIKYPELVEKLVLACTNSKPDEIGREILRMGREVAVKLGMRAVWLNALFWAYSRDYIERNWESIKGAMEDVPENEEALTGYLRQSVACEEHDTRTHLGRIKALTLIMTGGNDLITSSKRSEEELARSIPNSRLKIFQGVGHGFWRERQEEVDRLVLDFLLR